jgi:hypothetical protein
MLLAGTLLGLILAGCANSVTPTTPPTRTVSPSDQAIDVCPLVPDMDAIVGRAAAAPPSGFTIGAIDRCIWVYGSDPSRYVGVSVGPVGSHADGIDAFGEGESLESLGDDARWWSATQTLSVAIGDRSFQVDIRLGQAPAPAPKDLAVAIAQRVLGRLR